MWFQAVGDGENTPAGASRGRGAGQGSYRPFLAVTYVLTRPPHSCSPSDMLFPDVARSCSGFFQGENFEIGFTQGIRLILENKN